MTLRQRYRHQLGSGSQRPTTSSLECQHRGFIDGERLAHCKRQDGIDILIPARRDMDIYKDVLGLVNAGDITFQEYRAPRREQVDAPLLPESPAKVHKREPKRRKTVADKRAELPPPPHHC
jgi:hypothetical protein